MLRNSPCPDLEQLQRFLLGQLAESEAEALEQHLSSCRRCLDSSKELRPDDAFVGVVREGAGLGEKVLTEPEPALLQRLYLLGTARSRDVTPGPEETVPLDRVADSGGSATEPVESFLSPPETDGELGRLGAYRVLTRLGAGGMGIVFQAEDPSLRRLVALKVMRPALAANAQARERFLREAQAMAAVKHDHVLTIHQVGEAGGVPFLAMELLEGHTLEEQLKQQPRLPCSEVLRIGREMAAGLAAAHRRGLIHRDVKPANVWLEGEPGASATGGRVKLLDFGLARLVSEDQQLTQEGVVLGTPAYMAPEQAQGLAVDARCDLFSLGCNLYRMCTGVLPFQGASTMSLLLAVTTEQPKPPREHNPAIPPALSDLILRLLAKDPKDRPSSAQEVAEALQTIARTLPDPARPVPPRRTWLVAAVALALLGGLLALIVVIIRDRQGRVVARMPVPEGGSATLQDESKKGTGQAKDPAAPPADREKPFVLIRKGGQREEFKHLTGALAVFHEGDAIEVHGNGPFTVPAVKVAGRRVVLKAAPGYRPQFVATLPPGHHRDIWLDLRGGVVMEGCDFRATDWRRVLSGGGDWEVRNCRFYCIGPLRLCWHRGASLRFADCVLCSNNTVFDLAAKDRVELTNNVIVSAGQEVLSLAAPGGQVVRCTRNTLVFPFKAILFAPAAACTEPIVVEAAGNLFQGGSMVADEKFPAGFRWQGRDNLYVGPEVLRAAGADGKWGPANLAAWSKRWGRPEEGSRQVERVSFQIDALQVLPAAEALPLVQSQATRLLKGLPGPAAKVGPDWDLVGPGDAYVRALAAEKGKGGPSAPRLDRLRPEPLPGGPFVLIRAGKEVRGFVGLQGALVAAQKDDVIEIRTDGPFPGAFRDHDVALTIRAAPGYRPVVSSMIWFNSRKGDLRLEGLTFDDARLTGYYRNLSVRNCAFRIIKEGSNMGLVVRGQGQPVEFRNCIVSRGTTVSLDKDRTLVVDNCLTAGVLWSSVEADQPCTVLIRRTAVWYPSPAGYLFWAEPPKPQVSFRTEHTLIVSGTHLFSFCPAVKWQGQGNVYGIRGSWFGDWIVRDLPGWQKKFGSDADARELPPVLVDPALWQLLPGQPKTSAGQDYGADVSRIAGTKGRSGVVKEPSAPPADREKPFVLIRKGGQREEFKHLTGALAVFHEGDAIEVHGNGPFTVPAVKVAGRRVVLKAAPGYRPQFVATLPPGHHHGKWLDLMGGAVLEGCDFRATHWFAVLAGDGDWEVRNCRFFCNGPQRLCWHGGTYLRFADCVLCSNSTVFVLAAKDQVELTNNVIVSSAQGLLFLAAPGGQVVRCTRNTLVCPFKAILFAPAPACTEPIVVEAAGNLFQGGSMVADEKFPAGFRWQGRDNLYVGPEVLRAAGADGKWGPANLAAWSKRWGRPEERSRQVERVSFQIDALQVLPAAEALPLVQSQATRLLKGLPGPAAKVGPDWDLVGPGDAYVRALAAEKGKGGPSAPRLDRLRPEPLPGGPFVLIRAGKEVRGFVGLQGALVAAQKEDVIEIRAEGPFPGAFRDHDVALTIRAAPGYRPVVSSMVWFESRKGDLRLEGLTFDEARLTGVYRNLSVRNCAFRIIKEGTNMGLSVRGQGQPVEFRNCILSRGTTVSLDKDRTLVVDNCLTSSVMWTSVAEDQPCTVLIRRTALWYPFPATYLFWTSLPKHQASFRAEHTLFVSGMALFGFCPAAKWEGQGNAYGIRGSWFGDWIVRDLPGWQKKFGSDADARELPPVLLDPTLWQLLPGQPKTSAGQDYGADVSRIAGTKGRSGVVKEPSAPPADREKPFVLIRKGGQREEFKHLASALAVLQDGDAIEVHGNGPFIVPAVRVPHARVVLRAAPGYRPQFTAALPEQKKQVQWLILRGGALLEGCDFTVSHWRMAFVGGGDWEVRNCRFRITAVDYFCNHEGRRLRFADCLLFCSNYVVFELAAKDEVELTNNVIVATRWPKGVLCFAAPGGQTVRCTNNTLVGFAQEGLFLPEPGCTEPITVESAGNVFQGGRFQGGRVVPDGKAVAGLRWQGRDNLYVGPEVLRAAGADGRWGQADLAAWSKRWGRPEEGSRQVERVSFRLDALGELPTTEALPQVQALATRLLKGLRDPAKKVGPDWGLVGPGDAYVRALAAEKGKGGPSAPRLDRLRPQPLPGGPFVLIRAGKEVRGFVGLEEAFHAARKDDVIEVRTDGPFRGGNVPGPERDMALTVRAAPGYRPVLTSEINHQPRKGDLRLEGVTFDGASLTGAYRNLSVRNCAFWNARSDRDTGVEACGAGQPVEFRNCFASRSLSVKLDRDRTLLVDNCFTGAVRWVATEVDQRCSILIRRSALWSPGPVGVPIYANKLKHASSVRAEQTLFVSGYNLFSGIHPTKWEGQGNVYSIGGPWFAEGQGPDLEAWQKKFGSDADARELPLLLLDPALWQLLPGQPKRLAGRDYGADVSRVAVTKGGAAPAPPPLDEAWLKEVAALPADKQVEAVAAKLKERNPDFDGKVTPRIQGGVVVELRFVTDHVADISPLRGLKGLVYLTCSGSAMKAGQGKLADLSPLKDLKLELLGCSGTRVSDLSPLKGMKLKLLYCNATFVSDLTPLKDMPLDSLHCNDTPVADLTPLQGMKLTHLLCTRTRVAGLSPLQGMKLTHLWCDRTGVTDLSALKGMPLRELHCDFKPERDAEVLRSLQTLETINSKPAAEFWKEVSGKEQNKKP